MFVDIESFKGAIGVENILMPYKKGRLSPDKKTRLPKEHITPDVCWQILKSTNNPVNIQHMLECIAELPASEQAHFKEVVLATFSNREQPNKQPYNIVLLGKKLAAASGYEAELADAQKLNEGGFLLSAPKLDKVFVCLGNSFSDVDFSAYDKVIFFNSEKIEFGENVKFPKNVEFPNSLDVSFLFYNKDNDLCGCDLSEIQSIFFKDGAKVDLYEAKNLPLNLDVSMCDEVDLGGCDLSEHPNLRFKDGAKVCLTGATNLLHNLDFSRCAYVRLVYCDLSNQTNLRFKDGATVDLNGATNLPPNLDVSMCADVNLSNCDLYQQTNLRFKDGAIVNLGAARNLPPNLDVSQCELVHLSHCDLRNVQCLTFKNHKQMKDSEVQIPDNWKGKIVFADGTSMIANRLGNFFGKLFDRDRR